MNTYFAIAYDCPDKELINDMFEIEAPSLEEARRIARKAIPHAIAWSIDECDNEDDDDE